MATVRFKGDSVARSAWPNNSRADAPNPDGNDDMPAKDQAAIVAAQPVSLVIKYDTTDKDIAVMREKYTGLTISNTKEYEAVRLAIADCRTTRVAIDKRRLELNAEAQKHIKAVNGAAKVMIDAIEQIENPLQLVKDAEDERKRKEKEAKEAAERARIEEELRVKREAEEAVLKQAREAEEARLKIENERIAKENNALREERDKLEAEKRALEVERQAIEQAKLAKANKGKKKIDPVTISACDALARLMEMVEPGRMLSPHDVAAIKRVIEYVGELEKRLANVNV